MFGAAVGDFVPAFFESADERLQVVVFEGWLGRPGAVVGLLFEFVDSAEQVVDLLLERFFGAFCFEVGFGRDLDGLGFGCEAEGVPGLEVEVVLVEDVGDDCGSRVASEDVSEVEGESGERRLLAVSEVHVPFVLFGHAGDHVAEDDERLVDLAGFFEAVCVGLELPLGACEVDEVDDAAALDLEGEVSELGVVALGVHLFVDLVVDPDGEDAVRPRRPLVEARLGRGAVAHADAEVLHHLSDRVGGQVREAFDEDAFLGVFAQREVRAV